MDGMEISESSSSMRCANNNEQEVESTKKQLLQKIGTCFLNNICPLSLSSYFLPALRVMTIIFLTRVLNYEIKEFIMRYRLYLHFLPLLILSITIIFCIVNCWNLHPELAFFKPHRLLWDIWAASGDFPIDLRQVRRPTEEAGREGRSIGIIFKTPSRMDVAWRWSWRKTWSCLSEEVNRNLNKVHHYPTTHLINSKSTRKAFVFLSTLIIRM